MDIKSLTVNLSISPQVLVNEMEAVAQAGFKAIICNRPDGEGPDQPSFKEIEAAAEHYGIQAQYLPAETGKVSDQDGQAFGQLLQILPHRYALHHHVGAVSSGCYAFAADSRSRSKSRL